MYIIIIEREICGRAQTETATLLNYKRMETDTVAV